MEWKPQLNSPSNNMIKIQFFGLKKETHPTTNYYTFIPTTCLVFIMIFGKFNFFINPQSLLKCSALRRSTYYIKIKYYFFSKIYK